MRVLVTGASGLLGSALVPKLVAGGHQVSATSRRSRSDSGVAWLRADVGTGEGLADAVSGAQAVVHLASGISSSLRRGHLQRVDVEGTRKLGAAAKRSGVQHLVYVSIVGVDRVPYGYYHVKLAAEQMVRDCGVPWTILRATQFFPFLDLLLSKVGRLPVIPGDPRLVSQPVDTREVADRIVERLGAGPMERIEEYGGPERLTFAEVARQWQAAQGKPERLLRLPIPGALAGAVRDEGLTTDAQPAGVVTWRQWLTERYGDV
jgi:uncharacterized protein YbjT (DUF2867 family)